MTERQPEGDRPKEGLDPAVPAPQDQAVEAKRLAARRLFLLGGATAASMVVTVSRARALTFSECAENAEARGFQQATEFLSTLNVDGSDPAGLFCNIFFRN